MQSPNRRADTIAAIATAAGCGGIGVVRVSGPQVRALAEAIVGRLPPARRATLCRFLDDKRVAIDEGIALYYPAPASYTGEDVLELQGHGGPVVLQLLLQRCIDLGARLAEPGEFTRRAFLNDKLDLAQAEGIADLIEASTAAAARSAMRSLVGDFSTEVEKVRRGLIELRTVIEATLDFAEEEVDVLDVADALGRLEQLRGVLAGIAARARHGSLLRSGLHVVIAGQPNVGKSSLLNRLAGEERALVTAVAGTTRDALRETIQIAGIPLHVTDTAGLRETEDEVERLGIGRAWYEIASADVVVLMVDARRGMTAADEQIAQRLPQGVQHVRVYNKIDLVPRGAARQQDDRGAAVFLSAKTGEGLDLLRDELLRSAGWHSGAEDVFMARERHLRALAQASHHVDAALAQNAEIELLAEELRLAHQALGEITGEFTADDLLGEIFSRFCIGK